MIRGIVGTKDIQDGMRRISEELPGLREDIVEEIRKDMKTEFINAAQAMEMRIKSELNATREEIIKIVGKQTKPENVVNAIEERKENDKRTLEKGEIIKALSLIYTAEKEQKLYYRDDEGSDRLTEAGSKIYNKFSETVLRIARLNGSKSHMKVANRSTYDSFCKSIGEMTSLEKVCAYRPDGTAADSVYSDVIKRGLLGKLSKFLEKEFVVNA